MNNISSFVVFVIDQNRYDNFQAMTVLKHGDSVVIQNRVWNGHKFVWQDLSRIQGRSIEKLELRRVTVLLERRGHAVLGTIDITYEKIGLVLFKEHNGDPGTPLPCSLIKPV